MKEGGIADKPYIYRVLLDGRSKKIAARSRFDTKYTMARHRWGSTSIKASSVNGTDRRRVARCATLTLLFSRRAKRVTIHDTTRWYRASRDRITVPWCKVIRTRGAHSSSSPSTSPPRTVQLRDDTFAYASWQRSLFDSVELCDLFGIPLPLPDTAMLYITCEQSLSSLWLLAKRNFLGFLRAVRRCARSFVLEQCHCEECCCERGTDTNETVRLLRDHTEMYTIMARYTTGTLGLAVSEILARVVANARTKRYLDEYAPAVRTLLHDLFATGNVPLAVPFALYVATESQLRHEVNAFIRRHEERDRPSVWSLCDCEFPDRGGFCVSRLDDIDVNEMCPYRRCEERGIDPRIYLGDGKYMSMTENLCWRVAGVHSTPVMQALHLITVARNLTGVLDTCDCVYELELVRRQTHDILDRHFDRGTLSGRANRQLFVSHGANALSRCPFNLPRYQRAAFAYTVSELRDYFFVDLVLQNDVLLPHLLRCIARTRPVIPESTAGQDDDLSPDPLDYEDFATRLSV